MSNDEEYPVGYKHPPKKTQFKPGESGNKKGRPKGSRNLSTEIENELNTRVDISENGKRKKITKRKAIAKQTVNKAASGDHKAMAMLFHHDRNQENKKAVEIDPGKFPSAADQERMASIIDRIRRNEPSEPSLATTDENTQSNTNQKETEHEYNI